MIYNEDLLEKMYKSVIFSVKNVLILVFLAVLVGCGSDTEQMQVGEESRTYQVYVPENLPEKSPLIIAMHPLFSSGSQFRDVLQFDQVADKYSFVIAYPDGSELDDGRYWNAKLRYNKVDDVTFIKQLIESLQGQYDTDPDRVFVIGFSNGGYMGYELACTEDTVVTAVISVGGTMSGDTWKHCSPESAVSIFQISGTLDQTIPTSGLNTDQYGWGGAPAIDDVANFWSRMNNNENVRRFVAAENIRATVYSGGLSNAEVWYYEVSTLNHRLPTLEQDQINFPELAWDFLSRQRKSSIK